MLFMRWACGARGLHHPENKFWRSEAKDAPKNLDYFRECKFSELKSELENAATMQARTGKFFFKG